MSTLYSSGGPWSIGDGYVPLANETITQTIYLSAVSGTGVPVTKAKVWFAGNGVDSYLVQAAWVTKGSSTVAVTVNGLTSFYIPAFGRWSDFFSTTSFTLPGTAYFYSTVKLNIPLLIPIIGDGDNTQTGPSVPGTITEINDDDNDAPVQSLLILNFDGVDGATTFVEEARNLIPTYSGYCELDTSKKKFGTASLLLDPTGSNFLRYEFPVITGDFTYHGWISVTNLAAWPDGYSGYLTPISIGDAYAEVYIKLYKDGGGLEWHAGIYDRLGNTIADEGNSLGVVPFVENTFHHFAVICKGRNIYLAIDGNILASYTAVIDNPFTGYYSLSVGSPGNFSPVEVRLDALALINYAKWTTNFTPPIGPPSSLDISTIEVSSTATITVIDNSLITVGDTITITEDSGIEVYTFNNTSINAVNEIVIGPDAVTTASNIVDTINKTYGAKFVATSVGSVVTVTKYTDDTVTITDDSSGIDTTQFIKSIVYKSSSASATIPTFTGYGEGTAFGDLGDIYGLSTVPLFTGDGTASRSGNVASLTLPAANVFANSFLHGDGTSSDEVITELLLCDNSWMEWFSALVVIPGDDDDTVLVVTQWVASNITYVSDLITWGVPDYWIDPRATLYYGVGDCEDGSFLVYSMLVNSGVSSSKLRVYFGTYNGEGHVWVVYYRESDSKWVNIDWTKGSTYWNSIGDVADLPLAYPDEFYQYTTAYAYVNCAGVIDLNSIAEYVTSIQGLYTEDGYMTLPMLEVTGQTGENGDGDLVLHALTVEGYCGVISETVLPSLSVDATGYESPLVESEYNLPSLTLEATVLTGEIATAEFNLPSLLVDSTGSFILIGLSSIELPSLELNATATVPLERGWYGICLNTVNFAPSLYSNFNFNSMCVFNGKVIGAGTTGIIEHTGSDDLGVDITAYWQLPSSDYGTHRQKSFRKVFLEGYTKGNLSVKAVIDDVVESESFIEALGVVGELQYTFPLNHDDRGALIGLLISNKDGCDFTINSVYGTIILGSTLSKGYTILGRMKIELPSLEIVASGS